MRKLISVRGLFTALMAATLVACATPPTHIHTTSNKDPQYTGKLQRVVLVTSPTVRPGFRSSWVVLAEKLRSRGVVVDLVAPDPLELDKGKALRDAVVKISASHVVTLQSTRSSYSTSSGGFGARSAATEDYESAVLDTANRKSVWRASTHFGYSRFIEGEREERLSASIVEKLQADGLL